MDNTWNPAITLVETLDEALAFKRWLGERRPIMGLDVETTGLNWWEPHFLRTTQFGDGDQAWVLPQEWWGKLVVDSLKEYTGPIVGHNIKFEMHALEGVGVRLNPAQLHDTKVAAWLLNPADKYRNGLKLLSTQHVAPWAAYPEYLKDKYFRQNKVSWATVPVDALPYWFYGGLDPILTCRLWEEVGHYATTSPYQQEMALLPIVQRAERAGMRVDLGLVGRMRSEYAEEMAELKLRCQQYGLENPGSGPQIEAALKGEGWEPEDWTPTGRAKLNKTILAGIPHELGDLVIQFKKLQKLDSSYLKNFETKADGDLLHGHINQLEARTGRMSVTQPALQTIPRGPVIRDCFIADEGCTIMSIDYAQIELRLLAHYSQDPRMIEQFLAGEDLHNMLATSIFGPDFTKPQRTVAKNSWFSKAYGAGVEKFAETAGCTVDFAQSIYDGLSEAYPGIQGLQDYVIETGRARLKEEGRGYVRLFDGTELPMDDDAIYAGVDYLLQGTAGKVLKRAMVDLDAAGLGSLIRMPIHDEVIFQVPKEDEEEAKALACQVMTNYDYAVPLLVDAVSGLKRWGDKARLEGS